MPNSQNGEETRAQEGPDLVTFPEMPDRLVAAGLERLSPQRCRQLAETDPAWPIPLDQAKKAGRIRLFDWRVLEPYFRERKSRQGQRTDRISGGTTDDARHGQGPDAAPRSG